MVIVAVDEDSLTVPFLVVEEPAMVRSFQAQFAAMWKSAHSVGIGAEDSLGSETVQQTLDILKSGVTDEVAARRLGVSVRTIRRRVAAVMELLGAESRFEAGVKAVQAGWL
jgi:DNA-binding NarL/FixJ family response regulator